MEPNRNTGPQPSRNVGLVVFGVLILGGASVGLCIGSFLAAEGPGSMMNRGLRPGELNARGWCMILLCGGAWLWGAAAAAKGFGSPGKAKLLMRLGIISAALGVLVLMILRLPH